MADYIEAKGVDVDIGTRILDIIMELLEDQTGERYTYERITEDKTA